jgi:protein gp37
MSDGTKIEWTDATWNPITGCTLVSEGCRHCYAARLAATRLRHLPSRQGLARLNAAGEAKFTGEVRFNGDVLEQPLRWKRARMIFVCAHGDLFHESVPDEMIDRIFAVMALCPQHTFQVLTKRPERMRAWFSERWQSAPAQKLSFGTDTIDMPAETRGEDRRDQVNREVEEICHSSEGMHRRFFDGHNDALWTPDGASVAGSFAWPLPNVWLGTSVEDQRRADERIPELLATPAAVRFISAEPLLGGIDLTVMRRGPSEIDPGRERVESYWCDGLTGQRGVLMRNGDCLEAPGDFGPHIDWVIGGGESGPGARPSHPQWFRDLRDQCASAGVAYFHKQNGNWRPWSAELPASRLAFMATDGSVKLDPTKADLKLAIDQATAGHDLWQLMADVGKHAAGRLLDGVEHNAMPVP